MRRWGGAGVFHTTAREFTPTLWPGNEAIDIWCIVHIPVCGLYLSCEYDEKTHNHYGRVSSILEIDRVRRGTILGSWPD